MSPGDIAFQHCLHFGLISVEENKLKTMYLTALSAPHELFWLFYEEGTPAVSEVWDFQL